MMIRQATEQDAADLVPLLSQLGYPASVEECQKRIKLYLQDGYHLLLGESNNHCIAFVAIHWYHAFHHPRPVGRIVAFCVDEKHRDQGLGSQLLNWTEDFLRQRDCLKVELTSNLRRKESHDYYSRKGYVQTSVHFIKYLTATVPEK